jgi:hypothetical protein
MTAREKATRIFNISAPFTGLPGGPSTCGPPAPPASPPPPLLLLLLLLLGLLGLLLLPLP